MKSAIQKLNIIIICKYTEMIRTISFNDNVISLLQVSMGSTATSHVNVKMAPSVTTWTDLARAQTATSVFIVKIHAIKVK